MTRNTIGSFVLAAALAVVGCKSKDKEGGDNSAARGTGIPECDALVKADEKFVACDKLPPEQKKAYADSFAKDKESYAHAKDKAATAEQCKQAMKDLVEGAKFRNCPLE